MNAQELVALLVRAGVKIATAESCTGGMVAAEIVGVPDASKVLEVSFVTYTEEAKCLYAGVSRETLVRYGVVSREVAGEMAAGVAERSGAQVGVATTGVAGPSGGTEAVPVGTVCFGISVNGQVYSEMHCFAGMSRNEVREAATKWLISRTGELVQKSLREE